MIPDNVFPNKQWLVPAKINIPALVNNYYMVSLKSGLFYAEMIIVFKYRHLPCKRLNLFFFFFFFWGGGGMQVLVV